MTINSGYLEYIQSVPKGQVADSLFKYRNRELRAMLENESSEVKAKIDVMCQRSVSTKEEAEVEALMNENMSEEEAREALRRM
jgi:methionine salvage enolase-phosphatase E1